jgi:hypothetical protein
MERDFNNIVRAPLDFAHLAKLRQLEEIIHFNSFGVNAGHLLNKQIFSVNAASLEMRVRVE